MPYICEKIKLPKEFDRRVKLSDDQREEIREKYATGLYSKRQLANEYCVSRRTIQFVCDPEKYKRSREQFKARQSDGRYKPTKEERARIMREHRRYKQKLYISGKLSREDQEELS